MSRSGIAWLGGILVGLVAGLALGITSSDREMQRRLAEQARMWGERTRELAERVEGATDSWREKSGEWREKSAENIQRSFLQAAEARDATLDAEPEDDTGSTPVQPPAEA